MFSKGCAEALERTASHIGYDAQLLKAVDTINHRQKNALFVKLTTHFGDEQNLKGKTIALWGLAFKPNTDDMRESPSRTLLDALWKAGASVQAFDPVAMNEAQRLYGDRPDITLSQNKYTALEGADALAICTEWQQFRAPDFDEMQNRLNTKTIVDGRNLYMPDKMKSEGWNYYSIGRI